MEAYLVCVKTSVTKPLYTTGGLSIKIVDTKANTLFLITRICYHTLCETMQQLPAITVPTGQVLSDFLTGNSPRNSEPILRQDLIEHGMPLIYDDMNFLSEHDADIPSTKIEFHVFHQTKTNDPTPIDISLQSVADTIAKLDTATINA